MVTYTSAFLAAANLIALAQAAPAPSVCQVVVNVYKGDPIWVPNSASTSSAVWGSWDPKDPKATSTTTTTSAWGTWDPKATSTSTKTSTTTTADWGTWDPMATSTTTTTTAWGSWSTSSSVKPTSSSTTRSGPWSTSSTSSSWSTTSSASYTTTTTKSTTTTTTTTTSAPAATATCSSGNYDFDISPVGSCGCQYTVECNMHAGYDQNTKFWEQTSGQLVDTLEQCIELCNNNAACQATVWSASDPTDTQDYKRCWQISGLGSTQGTGFGQISRKTSCSGSCSANYSG